MAESQVKQEFIQKAREAAVLGLEEMRHAVRNWNENNRTPEQWLDYGKHSLQHIQKLTNVKIQFQIEDVYWNLFHHSREVAETVVRAMLEGVSNAIRHGNASTIKINLQSTSERIQLFIRDDGIGLVEKDAGTMGIGLLSLRSLAEELYGRLVIERSPYQGTTLSLTIPSDKKDLGGVRTR
jgi:signal transduction histidine kinase